MADADADVVCGPCRAEGRATTLDPTVDGDLTTFDCPHHGPIIWRYDAGTVDVDQVRQVGHLDPGGGVDAMTVTFQEAPDA